MRLGEMLDHRDLGAQQKIIMTLSKPARPLERLPSFRKGTNEDKGAEAV